MLDFATFNFSSNLSFESLGRFDLCGEIVVFFLPLWCQRFYSRMRSWRAWFGEIYK